MTEGGHRNMEAQMVKGGMMVNSMMVLTVMVGLSKLLQEAGRKTEATE